MPKSKKAKKVFVGMSGGVDSSVAAALLKKQGYGVLGVHLKCYNVDGCAEQDAEDARRAAEVLGIPFYVFDMEQEYKDKVVEYMVDGYRKGITPNPDVMCNKEIKFGLFLKKALEMGADYVATGHYVRLRRKSQIPNPKSQTNSKSKIQKKKSLEFGACNLEIAKDEHKDQSYFLWTLTQDQLKHCLFPIGEYKKPEVRRLAKKFGLPNAEKKDSQGICFLGQVTLKDFLGNYIPKKKGLVLNSAGDVVGKHSGAYFYTIGQRNGLGIGGYEKPQYVAEKNVKTNTVVIASEDDPMLYRKEVVLRDINFIDPALSSLISASGGNGRIDVLARVRYRQALVPALLVIHNSLFKLVFNKPVKFVASGQSAVFYKRQVKNSKQQGGCEMIGGGVIV